MADDSRSQRPYADGESGSVAVLFSSERTRVVLGGEVDVSLSAELTDAISEAQAAELPVDVDVRQVTFMDSSGAAMLARLAARMPHKVRIIQPPDVVRFLLEVTAIGESVEILEDVPDFPSLPHAVEEAAPSAVPQPTAVHAQD